MFSNMKLVYDQSTITSVLSLYLLSDVIKIVKEFSSKIFSKNIEFIQTCAQYIQLDAWQKFDQMSIQDQINYKNSINAELPLDKKIISRNYFSNRDLNSVMFTTFDISIDDELLNNHGIFNKCLDRLILPEIQLSQENDQVVFFDCRSITYRYNEYQIDVPMKMTPWNFLISGHLNQLLEIINKILCENTSREDEQPFIFIQFRVGVITIDEQDNVIVDIIS